MLVLLSLATSVHEAGAMVVPMVFFRYEESSLDVKSEEVIEEAVKNRRGSERVLVTGFCDAAEKMKDCPSLAQRRADAVKDALVRLGIDADKIATSISMDLLVPTAEGVREPQNRRVVIGFSVSPN